MIRPHLEKDPTKFSTMEQFEQAISEGAQSPELEDQDSTAAKVQGEGQNPVKNGQDQIQNGAAMKGRQQGGGMMQGNANIGLVRFVRERIENVNKQLNGEISSAGNVNEQSGRDGGMRGQPGNGQNRPVQPDGMQPPGGMREPIANMEGQRRADVNGGPGEGPGEARNAAQKGRFQNISNPQLYLVGGSLGLLLGGLLFVLKRKTKYSI